MNQSPVALPRSTPEEAGLPSQAILDLLADLQAQGPGQEIHSLMILRHGKVLAEGWWQPYEPELKHLLYSLSKSFTSSAVGLAIGEGLLTLEDSVLDFFPDQAPQMPSENLRAMKVKHLLSMSAGQAEEPWTGLNRPKAKDWVAGFLAHEVENKPGTAFHYNSFATFMLAAIVEKLTGQSLLTYLKPRLLDPLGIDEATWDLNPEGIVVGGWGMSIKTESIAKFGQLYLQDGVWEGRRLLPEGWVVTATSKQVENGTNPDDDWQSGYGFQFWRCKTDCYRADGAFGQLCVVVPRLQMVIAMTACVDFMHEVLNALWKHLLPAAQPAPLAENPETLSQLHAALASLNITSPPGQGFASSEAFITGHAFKFDDPEISAMRWAFSAESIQLTVVSQGTEHLITAGRKCWRSGDSSFENDRHQPVAAMGTWLNPTTYRVTLQLTEEPASVSFTAEFVGDGVKVSIGRRGRLPAPPQMVTLTGSLRD